jgi:hypothetical protein
MTVAELQPGPNQSRTLIFQGRGVRLPVAWSAERGVWKGIRTGVWVQARSRRDRGSGRYADSAGCPSQAVLSGKIGAPGCSKR